MAGFWKPRRQTDTAESAGESDAELDAASESADDAGDAGFDPELAEQLAHLDAIERRHEQIYTQGDPDVAGGERAGPTVVVPEAAWPEAIPPLPDPGEGAGALLRWLDTARAVLSARASRNRDELQRLTSQWVHISRHLTRFRPEEVAAVVESEARVRERIAADETVCHLIQMLHGHLATGAEAPPQDEPGALPEGAPPPAPLAADDVAMLRTLLDSAATDRVRSARDTVGTLLEELSALALDLEVVQRQAERQPEGAAGAVRALQDRLTGVVEDLRARPGTELVVPHEGEPLHATLRRCLDAYQQRLGGDLAWSGGDPDDPAVRAALLWITQEFLAGMAAEGGREARLALASGPDEVVLRLSAAAAPEVLEAGWVLRCRARAAVAGGALLTEAAPDTCTVEARFPTAGAAPGATG